MCVMIVCVISKWGEKRWVHIIYIPIPKTTKLKMRRPKPIIHQQSNSPLYKWGEVVVVVDDSAKTQDASMVLAALCLMYTQSNTIFAKICKPEDGCISQKTRYLRVGTKIDLFDVRGCLLAERRCSGGCFSYGYWLWKVV